MESKTAHNWPGHPQFRTHLWALGIGMLFLFLMGIPGWAAASPGPGVDTGASWFVDMNRFAQSAHAGFTCETCHGTMQEHGRRHPDPTDPDFLKKTATRTFDYGRCQKCHKVAYDRYLKGGHAAALSAQRQKQGALPASTAPEKLAPTCGSCHVSHYERSHRSRVETGRQMVETCGRCHAEHAASYMENIHGKVGVNLENPKSAYCTDCHGAHTVASLKKPEDALVTCRRCHPEADTAFAGFVIHDSVAHISDDAAAPKDGAILWIHRVRLAVIAVVVLSLVFFFGHSFLWLLRELHEKLRKH